MSRTQRRPAASLEHRLVPCFDQCWSCGAPMWVAYTKCRKLMTLAGLLQLHLSVRRCRTPGCAHYHRP